MVSGEYLLNNKLSYSVNILLFVNIYFGLCKPSVVNLEQSISQIVIKMIFCNFLMHFFCHPIKTFELHFFCACFL